MRRRVTGTSLVAAGRISSQEVGHLGCVVSGQPSRAASVPSHVMSEPLIVTVPMGERTYPVLVGKGVRRDLAQLMPASARRAAVVTQAGIGVEVDPGVPFETFAIPDGEQAKELGTIGELCSGFARFGLTRRDVVVGVGGGVVTDVAGFAAAVYHRGVAVVHLATTLLGQIDAAVGGKTGREPRGGQESRRSVLAASSGPVRHRSAGLTAGARTSCRFW